MCHTSFAGPGASSRAPYAVAPLRRAGPFLARAWPRGRRYWARPRARACSLSYVERIHAPRAGSAWLGWDGIGLQPPRTQRAALARSGSVKCLRAELVFGKSYWPMTAEYHCWDESELAPCTLGGQGSAKQSRPSLASAPVRSLPPCAHAQGDVFGRNRGGDDPGHVIIAASRPEAECDRSQWRPQGPAKAGGVAASAVQQVQAQDLRARGATSTCRGLCSTDRARGAGGGGSQGQGARQGRRQRQRCVIGVLPFAAPASTNTKN